MPTIVKLINRDDISKQGDTKRKITNINTEAAALRFQNDVLMCCAHKDNKRGNHTVCGTLIGQAKSNSHFVPSTVYLYVSAAGVK